MEITGGKVNAMLSLKPNTKEYKMLKNTLTEEERSNLKKQLKKRSDKRYLQKKHMEIEQNADGDLVTEVRVIKELLSELVIAAKSRAKNTNVFEITESTFFNSSASASSSDSGLIGNFIAKP